MSEPERIDAADLSEALDALIENPSDPSFNEIGRLATVELQNRLATDPTRLPGTDLMKLVTAYYKAKAAGETTEDKPEEPDPDVLDLIQQPGLPDERKRGLLLEEATRLRDRLSDIDAALEGLDE